MSYQARVMGLERAIGYERFRMMTATRWKKHGAAEFACGCCGRDYLVDITVSDQHEAEPLCPMCMPPGREANEIDLRFARLLGRADDE